MPAPPGGGLPPGGGGNLVNNGPARPGALDPLPFTDKASLYNQGSSQSVITDYQVKNYYERDGHIYMMGVASPNGFQGNSASFVQLAAPTLLWIADWTGCRFQSKPMVPDPTSVGSNWILMDSHLVAAQIILAPDGVTPLYRITGTYIFGAFNPGSSFFSNVMFPAAPWFNSDGIASLRSITTADLQKGILIPQGGVGGGGNLPPGGPVFG